MRNLILLPFLLLFLNAKCQEPDAYSQPIVDSLKTVINEQNEIIAYQDSLLNSTGDTIDYILGDLSVKVNPIDGGLRIDFKDADIDRRFHFYYDNKRRIVILGDGLKASGPINFDWNE